MSEPSTAVLQHYDVDLPEITGDGSACGGYDGSWTDVTEPDHRMDDGGMMQLTYMLSNAHENEVPSKNRYSLPLLPRVFLS